MGRPSHSYSRKIMKYNFPLLEWNEQQEIMNITSCHRSGRARSTGPPSTGALCKTHCPRQVHEGVVNSDCDITVLGTSSGQFLL